MFDLQARVHQRSAFNSFGIRRRLNESRSQGGTPSRQVVIPIIAEGSQSEKRALIRGKASSCVSPKCHATFKLRLNNFCRGPAARKRPSTPRDRTATPGVSSMTWARPASVSNSAIYSLTARRWMRCCRAGSGRPRRPSARAAPRRRSGLFAWAAPPSRATEKVSWGAHVFGARRPCPSNPDARPARRTETQNIGRDVGFRNGDPVCSAARAADR
jgi:hypothetical protein